MNTIKIYFDTDGSIKELKKDFQLYQGQFHDKLLNVYVPTSVLAPDFTVENEQEQTIADFVASSAVKVGMKYLARNGSIKKSKNYYLNYLKTMVQNNVEYAVFERKLPKEFTTYVGQGQNAPMLVVNVENIEMDTDPVVVLSVITTQECFLDVMPSAELNEDEPVEPSELALVNAEINGIKETLFEKQDKIDPALQTTHKDVIGAINENRANIGINTDNVATNSEDIANLRNDISEIQDRINTSETPIGKLSGNNLPDDVVLGNFVHQEADRSPAINDVVIFELTSTTPHTNYKYTFTLSGWVYYVITTIVKAENGTYGVLTGTYSIGDTADILVDIDSGKILNIWVKDASMTTRNGEPYRALREYLSTTNQRITDIVEGINGTTVYKALRAIADELGNDIVETYMTKELGATKQFVRDYAMPRKYSNVYYLSTNGYVPAVPTTPASGVQFETEVASIAQTQICQIPAMTLNETFDLTTSNTYQTDVWVSATEDCNVQFILATEYQKVGEEWASLVTETTNPYALVGGDSDIGGNIVKIEFASPFVALGNTELSLVDGDKIRQTLYVKSDIATATTFRVFSNATYPSLLQLTSLNYHPSFGGTVVSVDSQPVATWNADTKADLTNPSQTVTAESFVAKQDLAVRGNIGANARLSLRSDGEEDLSDNNQLTVNVYSDNNPSTGGINPHSAGGSFYLAHGDFQVDTPDGETVFRDDVRLHYGASIGSNTSNSAGIHYNATTSQLTNNKAFKTVDSVAISSDASANPSNTTTITTASSGATVSVETGDLTISGESNTKITTVMDIEVGKIKTTSGLTDGNNANYNLKLPDTTSWTSNKTIATTDFVANIIPIGSVVYYAGSVAPTGYLMCNGQAVSRTTYAVLFAVIGTTYGTGDGSTTFNLPNLTEKFVFGASSNANYSMGAIGGSKDAVVVKHSHAIQAPNGRKVGFGNGNAGYDRIDGYTQNTDISQQIFTTTDGVDGTDKNMPPYICMNYIIRVL